MQNLKDWLKKTIADIKNANGQIGPPLGIMSGLRDLQLRINPLVLSNVDSKTRFMAYFLNNYIDTIFMDLFGDIPDDGDGILEGVRENFFEKTVGNLDHLFGCLEKDSDPLPALENLVFSYTEAINALNYADKKLTGRPR